MNSFYKKITLCLLPFLMGAVGGLKAAVASGGHYDADEMVNVRMTASYINVWEAEDEIYGNANIYIYGEPSADAPDEDNEDDTGMRSGYLDEMHLEFTTWTNMVPWKSYDLVIERHGYDGWRPGSKKSTPMTSGIEFAAPQGYDILVNGVSSKRFTFYASGEEYIITAKVQVIPAMETQKARTGVSTSLAPKEIFWSAFLGEATSGDPLGSVYVRHNGEGDDWDLSSAIGAIFSSVEGYVMREPYAVSSDGEIVQGKIAQVVACDTVVDIAYENNGKRLKLRFFHMSQCEGYVPIMSRLLAIAMAHSLEIGPREGLTYQRFTFEGNPYIQYTFDVVTQDGVQGVKLTKEVYHVEQLLAVGAPALYAQESYTFKHPTSQGTKWVTKDWVTVGNDSNAEVSVEVNQVGNMEAVSILEGDSYVSENISVRSYEGFPGLAKALREVDKMGVNSEFYYQKYDLWENADWSNLVLKSQSNGYLEAYEWEFYGYYFNPETGMYPRKPYFDGFMTKKYKPFLNFIPQDNGDGTVDAEGMIMEFSEAPLSWGVADSDDLRESHYLELGSSGRVKIGEKQFKKDTDNSTTTTRSYYAEGKSIFYVEHYVRKDNAAGTPGSTWSNPLYHYLESKDRTREVYATGKQIDRSYALDQYYQPSPLPGPSYFGRRAIVDTSITSHKGTLVNGLSQKTETVRDGYGHLREVREHIYRGNTWHLLSWEKRDYNRANQLIRVEYSSGRVEEFEYTGEYKTRHSDGNGAVTTYEYDNLGRVITETIEGKPDDGIGNLTTSYEYNALGGVIRKSVKGSGDESLDYECEYDQHGRKTREKTPGTDWVRFSYNTTARTETTIFPDNSWKTESKYIDGKLRSITGNAVINEFHHYYLSQKEGQEGFIVHETRIGSDNNSPQNSPRITTETKDWLGRVVERTVPAAPGQGNTPQVETYHYHPDTGLLVKKEITGGPTTFYTYNQFGELIETTLRVDSSIVTETPLAASTDEMARTTYEYKSGGDYGLWYKETNSYTYGENQNGTPSATPIRLSTVKDYIIDHSKLTGPNANLRSYTTTLNGDGHTSWQKTWVYPEEKRTVTEVGGDGVGTTRTTHINGLLVETQNPDGLIYRSHYDDLWRVTTNEDPRTGNSTVSYVEGTTMVHESRDPANRLITRNTYDFMGRVIQVQDTFGKSMYTQYSPRGEPLRIWGQTTNPVSYTYDQYGVKVEMRSYRDDENTDWSTSTWPTSIGPDDGDYTRWVYHPATGLLLSKTDAANKTVSYTYDQLARVKTKTLAREVNPGVPLTLTYHYYGDNTGELKTGRLKTVSYNDQVTPTVSYTYNRLGNTKTVTESNIGTRSFSYNATYPWRVETEQLPAYLGSRLLTQLYQNGANNTVPGRIAGYRVNQASTIELQQSYGYDPLNARVTSVTAANAQASTRTYSYQYHSQAPLLSGMSISDSPLTITRNFDPHRNLVTQLETALATTDGPSPVVHNAYHHDDMGRRSHILHKGRAYQDYGHGKALLRHIAYSDRSEVTQDDAYLVDDSTQPANLDPAAATALSNRHYRYAYDAFGNRKSSSFDGDHTKADYTTNHLNQYTQRANVGTPLSGTAHEDTHIITHEQTAPATAQAASKQLSWWSSTIPNAPQGRHLLFTITAGLPADAAANRGSDHYTRQSHALLIPPALQEYSYDADGNLLSDGLHDYHWDAHDRLIKIQTSYLSSLYGATGRSIEFTYDYLGRRIGKKVSEANTPLAETRYLYKGWDLIAEYKIENTQAPQLHRSYAWGLDLTTSLTGAGGVGALLQIHDHQQNKSYHPAYDGNGNLMALVEHATNTLAATYEYSPYGELIRATGPYAQENPIRFATQYHDNETGLIYYHKRYYSPDMGRFINRDPIEEKGGLNLYAYCQNNAINTYDVLGMYTQTRWNSGSPTNADPTGEDDGGGDDGMYDFDMEGEEQIRVKDKDGNEYELTLQGVETRKNTDGSETEVKTWKVTAQINADIDAKLVKLGTLVKSETQTKPAQDAQDAGNGDKALLDAAGKSKTVNESGKSVPPASIAKKPSGGDKLASEREAELRAKFPAFFRFLSNPTTISNSFEKAGDAHIAGALLAAIKGGSHYKIDSNNNRKSTYKGNADTYEQHEYIWGILKLADGTYYPTYATTQKDEEHVTALHNPLIKMADQMKILAGIGHNHPYTRGSSDFKMSGYGSIFLEGDRNTAYSWGVNMYMTCSGLHYVGNSYSYGSLWDHNGPEGQDFNDIVRILRGD